MNFTFSQAKILIDNGVWLCLKVNEPAPAKNFVVKLLNSASMLYDCVIKQHREKRSLDANAYYWKLCGELAQEMRENPNTTYRRHIRDVGNYETYCMETRVVERFRKLWTSNHLGRFVETKESKLPGCTTVLAYYGSSDFDRRQMSILIDNCIQDCKAVGIETMTPDKLELLKEEWNEPNGKSRSDPSVG